MRIRGLHIDGYGRFVDYRVENLSRGLTIFLGENEAGKSTLLAFIRSILFGFPDGRSAENRYSLPGVLQHGGRLFLEDEAGTAFTVRRHSGKKGGPVHVSCGDKEGDPLMLQQLLGAAGKDLFRNVFAFSLGELQQFETLNDQEVTSALYSAGLGTSAAALAKLNKDLASRKKELFTPGGSNAEICVLLKQLEEVQAEKRTLLNQAGRYEELVQTLESLRRGADELGERERTLSEKEMRTKRFLEAWPIWVRWSQDQEMLDSLPAARSIPTDSLPRLTALLERLAEAERRESGHRSRLAELRKRAEELPLDPALLSQSETLRRLAGHRTEWDRLRQALPGHERQKRELETQLRQRLTEIHPDWGIETLTRCDISMGRHNEFQLYHEQLSALKQQELLGKQSLAKAVADRQFAGQQLDESLEELAQLPQPDLTLGSLRESVLVDFRLRWRHSSEQARQAQDNFKHVSETLADQLEALGPDWTAERVKRTCAHRQLPQKCLEHRDILERRRQEELLAGKEVAALQKQSQALNEERDALSPASSSSEGRSAEELETLRERLFVTRSDMLRREKLKGDEDKGRAQTLSLSSAHQGVPAWMAAAIALCGVAVAVALAIHEQKELAAFVLVFMLIVAGVVHAVRAAALKGNLSSAEDKARRQQEAREELAKVQAELVEVEQRLADAAAALGLASTFTLDELDHLDRCLVKEMTELEQRRSLQQQLAGLDRRIQDCQNALMAAREAERSAVDGVKSAEKEWVSWLSELGLPGTLSPDAARELFSSLQRAAEQVRQLERATAKAQDDEQKAFTDAQRLVDLFEKAGRTVELSELDDQVTQLLVEIQGEAAKATRRAQAQSRVEENQRRMTRAQELCEELEKSLQTIQSAQRSAEKDWEVARGDLPAATPEAAIEILQLARAARELHDRAQAEGITCQEMKNSLEGMYEEVCSVFRDTGRTAPAEAELTSAFDGLLQDLQRHEKAEDERVKLQRDIAALSIDLDASAKERVAHASAIGELYAQAGVEDEVSFRKAAEIELRRAEYQQLTHGQKQALTVAASGMEFSEFVNHLESSTPDELMVALPEIQRERSELAEKRAALLQDQGRVQADLEALQASDALPKLRLKEEILKEQLQGKARDWAVLAMAESLVEQARRRFEQERQPDLLVRASAHFSNMTEGRYTRLVVPPGDNKVVMEASDGTRRESHELSRGTAEQAYLALRLGFVHEFSRRSEPLPMVMDDIFVNFDPQRAKAALREIVALTEGHQVLLFTCHPETVDRVLEVHPEADVRTMAGLSRKA